MARNLFMRIRGMNRFLNSAMKILIVTQNIDLLRAMQAALREFNRNIEPILLTEAFTLKQRCGCILVDQTSRGACSLEELSRLVSSRPEPVLALVDKKDINERRKAMESGVFDYIEIPIEPDRLRMSITNGLRYKQSVGP